MGAFEHLSLEQYNAKMWPRHEEKEWPEHFVFTRHLVLNVLVKVNYIHSVYFGCYGYVMRYTEGNLAPYEVHFMGKNSLFGNAHTSKGWFTLDCLTRLERPLTWPED